MTSGMTSHRSIAGAWAGGIAATLLLAAPVALWLILLLLLALAMTVAKG